MTPINTNQLLTLKEIGAELRVPARRVRSWVQAKTLPAVALGKRTIRVSRSDLGEFLKRFPYTRR